MNVCRKQFYGHIPPFHSIRGEPQCSQEFNAICSVQPNNYLGIDEEISDGFSLLLLSDDVDEL
jgi:hypothetical protein